jgi:hypothetical protein
MQIFGQMVRVPITARQKLSEAGYFYNGMLSNRTNVIVFPYFFSAFVSAFRSVTFFLQTQYGSKDSFKAWYAEKVTIMGADPVMVMLNKSRRAIVHLEPIDLFFTQGFEMPAKYNGVITTKHFELIQGQDQTGQVTMKIKLDSDGTEDEVIPKVAWHISEDDRTDLLQHCYHGLETLERILTELEGLRSSMGLAPDPDVSDFPAAL